MHCELTSDPAPHDFTIRVLVRLFRKWAAARQAFVSEFPEMETICTAVGLDESVVVASASLFELLESHLGRQLVPECCCSTRFSPDEHAIIALVQSAPGTLRALDGGPIPRELPTSLGYAASYLRVAAGLESPIAQRVRPRSRGDDGLHLVKGVQA